MDKTSTWEKEPCKRVSQPIKDQWLSILGVGHAKGYNYAFEIIKGV